MPANPFLKKLGLPEDARAVILHADDIGMCQATVSAYTDLLDFGLISSAAVMVPCAGFPAAAAAWRANPRADMGAHLTLTSEYDSYRWRPLSTCDPASGLLDDEGFFHHRPQPVQEKGDPAAVTLEITAQVQAALAAGIDLTHIDMHMFTLAHPKFIAGYLQLAQARRIPPLLIRMDEPGYRDLGLSPEAAAYSAGMLARLAAQGLPLMDAALYLPLNQSENRVELAKQVLSRVPPGLTHFIIHPAKDTPELRAITPSWPARVADYEAFSSAELRRWVRSSGLTVIGYGDIRSVM